MKDIVTMKYCNCGCGKKVTKLSNKYINGHNRRGAHHSEETKRKISISNKGQKRSKETKRKISEAGKGRILSQKIRRKMSEGHKGKSSGIKGKHHTEETKRRIGKASKRMWQNPEYRKKLFKSMFARICGKLTKPERRLKNGLNKMFPGEYKYIGDGKIIIGGKCPDFININGQKKIIEMFGDYWHSKKRTGRTRRQEENQRIKHFAKYGFKALIIWQRELQNIKQLKRKLVEFHGVCK